MAPQEARHQDAEHQNHKCRDNDQRDHAASFSASPQYPSGAGARRGTAPRGNSSGILRSVPVDELFLPEPEPREVRYTVISVDDHVVEPAHTFEGRLPRGAGRPGPAHRRDPRGAPGVGVRGRALHPGRHERRGRPAAGDLRARAVPLRPDAAGLLRRRRPGARHGHQRGLGVGQLPVQITGFCGRVFFDAQDPELGLACIRAWNDWLFEEWYSRHPDRIVPLGITYLADPGAGRGRDPAQRRRGASPR